MRRSTPRAESSTNSRSPVDYIHAHLNEPLALADLAKIAPEKRMHVSVVERKPTKIAYLRHVGPYGKTVSQFWQDTVYPWIASNGLLDQPRFGISHDDPSITSHDKCRYDAAVECNAPLSVPGQSMTRTLPGGKYGIAHFKGTADQIGVVWHQLLRDWLPSSGLQLEPRPFIECYTRESSYDSKTGVFTC